jgi:hypothetical protein
MDRQLSIFVQTKNKNLRPFSKSVSLLQKQKIL